MCCVLHSIAQSEPTLWTCTHCAVEACHCVWKAVVSKGTSEQWTQQTTDQTGCFGPEGLRQLLRCHSLRTPSQSYLRIVGSHITRTVGVQINYRAHWLDTNTFKKRISWVNNRKRICSLQLSNTPAVTTSGSVLKLDQVRWTAENSHSNSEPRKVVTGWRLII